LQGLRRKERVNWKGKKWARQKNVSFKKEKGGKRT